MSNRLTRGAARLELIGINESLKKVGVDRHLSMQGRNGYTGLDEFRTSDGCCLHTLKTGTPRECLNAALEYQCGVLESALLELRGKV